MNRTKLIALFSAALISLTGCGQTASQKSTESEDTKTSVSGTTTVQTEASQNSASDVTETSEEQPPEAEKLSFSEIEELAANCSYTVHWHSVDGDFDSGTAFVMDSAAHGQKLLVTAVHFLWNDEDTGFTGEDIPGYVTGGVIEYVKTFEPTGASLKNALVIKDARPVPDIDKDVAAFTVYGGKKLNSLKLSTHPVEFGDKLYLLANLWDTDDVHENCVYEVTAVMDKDGELIMTLDPRWGCMGASGGPVVNEYGEVVGILMAGGGECIYAHSSDSFLKQIEAAEISDITYPKEAGANQ
ncbi:MAG: serine protease [Ruminococcus sp.]|nr:serine protease [Ruminococcus sp.]